MSAGPSLTRRELLRHAALGAAGALAAPAVLAAEKSPYGPFKMSIQSYSLRGYNLDTALQKTKELGLHYWESFTGHVPLTTDPAQIAALQAKFKAADVRMLAHGVNGFGADKAKNRAIFEAARAMGIQTLSADPEPVSFDNLDELVDEFKINVAIHNHGPGARYDKIQSVVDAVKGHHARIGACVDCGHFLRSRENPVQAIELLGKRVYGVHLKDVKDATRFTILGQGDLDTVGVLKALKALKYNQLVSLEYEENPQNPMADIEACLAAVRAAVQKV